MNINTCPLSTSVPQPSVVPPVPAQVRADIPIVPSPAGDITDNSIMDMGGTTPPQESSRYAYSNSWDQYQKYQVSPPHAQNSPTPCSVIGKYPMVADREPAINGTLISDPNRGPRRCYTIKGSMQGMVGRVCTTPGTDGPLYSRIYPPGVNGNADYVRGNQFGVNYNSQMIDDPVDYVYRTPLQIKGNPRLYARNGFFPYPGYCRDKQAWVPDPSVLKPNYPLSSLSGRTYKTYPLQATYTDCGKPDWTMPYNTTQPGSRSPVTLVHEPFVNEGFQVCSSTKCSLFWLLVLIIMVSMFTFMRNHC